MARLVARRVVHQNTSGAWFALDPRHRLTEKVRAYLLALDRHEPCERFTDSITAPGGFPRASDSGPLKPMGLTAHDLRFRMLAYLLQWPGADLTSLIRATKAFSSNVLTHLEALAALGMVENPAIDGVRRARLSPDFFAHAELVDLLRAAIDAFPSYRFSAPPAPPVLLRPSSAAVEPTWLRSVGAKFRISKSARKTLFGANVSRVLFGAERARVLMGLAIGGPSRLKWLRDDYGIDSCTHTTQLHELVDLGVVCKLDVPSFRNTFEPNIALDGRFPAARELWLLADRLADIEGMVPVSRMRARWRSERISPYPVRPGGLGSLFLTRERTTLLLMLAAAGAVCAKHAALAAGLSPTGVVAALVTLRAAGLVRGERRGQRYMQSLDPDHPVGRELRGLLDQMLVQKPDILEMTQRAIELSRKPRKRARPTLVDDMSENRIG